MGNCLGSSPFYFKGFRFFPTTFIPWWLFHPHYIRFLHERSTYLQVLASPLLLVGSVSVFLPPATSWFDKMCCLVPILMPDSQQTKICINIITVSFGLVSHGGGKWNIQGLSLWLRFPCSNIAELQMTVVHWTRSD